MIKAGSALKLVGNKMVTAAVCCSQMRNGSCSLECQVIGIVVGGEYARLTI